MSAACTRLHCRVSSIPGHRWFQEVCITCHRVAGVARCGCLASGDRLDPAWLVSRGTRHIVPTSNANELQAELRSLGLTCGVSEVTTAWWGNGSRPAGMRQKGRSSKCDFRIYPSGTSAILCDLSDAARRYILDDFVEDSPAYHLYSSGIAHRLPCRQSLEFAANAMQDDLKVEIFDEPPGNPQAGGLVFPGQPPTE